MLLKIFLPLCVLVAPLLLGLDGIGGKGDDFPRGVYLNSVVWTNVTGMNQLAWGNVLPTNADRYWGHCVCAVITVLYSCYIFYHELRGYVSLRQKHLTSAKYRSRASATTVLISAIPSELCTKERLKSQYKVFPGGVREVWISRNLDSLSAKILKRDRLAGRLEASYTRWIRSQAKIQARERSKESSFAQMTSLSSDYLLCKRLSDVIGALKACWCTAVFSSFLASDAREMIRLPVCGILSWIPWTGSKVDAIDHYHQELVQLNEEINNEQNSHHLRPHMNSAFIQFNSQIAAHMACQTVSHATPLQMTPRATEIAPEDVIWDNMSMSWRQRWVRKVVVTLLVSCLIIGWTVPVAFTGVLSNLDSLSTAVHRLERIADIPVPVKGIMQGVVPSAMLFGLLYLLPVILRALAKFQGVTTGTAVELSVQWYYFIFLFVQVFLVVTLSTSLTRIIGGVNASTTVKFIPTVLATDIPSAANYFFNYIFLQACSVSAGVLAQAEALFGRLILGRLFDSTATEKSKRRASLPEIEWGTFYPIYTNLACIGLIYCTIAPLMSFFLLATFACFWFVYRYQTLYVAQFTYDTGGLLFAPAINQLFVGLYVMELCLFGLFLLVQGVDLTTGEPQGMPCRSQAAIIFLLFILTVVYQIVLNHCFGPLLQYLPIISENDDECMSSKAQEFEHTALRSRCPVLHIPQANSVVLPETVLQIKYARLDSKCRVVSGGDGGMDRYCT